MRNTPVAASTPSSRSVSDLASFSLWRDILSISNDHRACLSPCRELALTLSACSFSLSFPSPSEASIRWCACRCRTPFTSWERRCPCRFTYLDILCCRTSTSGRVMLPRCRAFFRFWLFRSESSLVNMIISSSAPPLCSLALRRSSVTSFCKEVTVDSSWEMASWLCCISSLCVLSFTAICSSRFCTVIFSCAFCSAVELPASCSWGTTEAACDRAPCSTCSIWSSSSARLHRICVIWPCTSEPGCISTWSTSSRADTKSLEKCSVTMSAKWSLNCRTELYALTHSCTTG